jgi:hypothetical protein
MLVRMKRYYEGEVSIFKQSGSPYWTAYYRDSTGRQRKKTLKTKNLKVAKQRARRLKQLVEAGDDGRLEALKRNRSATVGEVIERFIGERDDGPKGPGAGWAPTTKASTKPLLDKMTEQWGERSIAQIRHAEIQTFLGPHTSTTQKSSWNRYRATIRGLFKFAVEAEYIPGNPAESHSGILNDHPSFYPTRPPCRYRHPLCEALPTAATTTRLYAVF